MVNSMNTKLSRDEASQAFYHAQAIQRELNSRKFVLDQSVFQKNLAEKFDLKKAKRRHKAGLKAWYEADWKKHMNIPVSATLSTNN